MTYKIRTSSNSAFHAGDVLEWLQDNVGELLWSNPVFEYHGRGWQMNRYSQVDDYLIVRYVITIDDPKLATLATLRWL